MPTGYCEYQNKYTPEMVQWLRDNAWDRSRKELAEMFAFHFGVPMTEGRIKSLCQRYKIKNGRTGYFEKGKPSYNKGMKMSEEFKAKVAPTTFKKGIGPRTGSR